MRHETIKIIVFIFFFNISVVNTQNFDLESLLNFETSEHDHSELLDFLQTCLDKPLNVNKASINLLAKLPWISSTLASQIVHYRMTHGKIKNITELTSINEFNDHLEILKHFLTTNSAMITRFSIKGRQRLTKKSKKSNKRAAMS